MIWLNFSYGIADDINDDSLNMCLSISDEMEALAAEVTVRRWLSVDKSEASDTAESSSISDAVEALADDETDGRWHSIGTVAAGDTAVVDELVKASFGLASAADFNNFGRLVQSAISAADPDAEFSDELSEDFVDASA